ncbi:MAG: flagellar hook-basal body complex protein, partial [Nitrospirae bacterium]
MLSSLFSAISGLNANGVSLSVIGDNVANMNTVGFKRSRVSFGDVLSRAITGIGGNSQIGRGVIVTDVSPIFNQGSFETTSNALDMAIDGDGFFILKDSDATYYTRAGQFQVDKDGYIVNPDGYRVQGYQYTNTGQATGVIDDINISAVNSPPNATTEVLIAANLSSES